uniref:Uncharacterized protein n=1 Tax=Vitis vinifera TaxID=29760 RepID=A5ACW0_VITVI|nr:hypothetical protein VITISV_009643 [Vitis vinifera]
MPLLPCNECPPCALGPVLAHRGALKPSIEHVASEKRANGQRRGSPRELTHDPSSMLPIKRHTNAPPPMQRVPSPCTRPHLGSSRNPQARKRACYLGKACQWPTLRLTPEAHPCLPPDVAHQKAHGCPSPPCNECPPRALGPVSARRGALE